MHMRKKKWARPELAACSWYTEDGEGRRGRWRAFFARPEQPLHLEMGCGKGVSTAAMAADQPGVNFVAADLSADVLGCARRNAAALCGEQPGNLLLLQTDICFIGHVFAPEDGAERIYISFCNPWTEHPKHAKRRLTHPRQLMQYRSFLRPEGEIWFKTDDDTLFQDSLVYLDLCGFEIVYLTHDLHASGFSPNYVSEHEEKFAAQGVPIKFAIFRMRVPGPQMDPTRYRLTPGVRAEALKRLDRDQDRREDLKTHKYRNNAE
ncbi:MAG: tRNA (guanosine(46)-N7)-methyltransferase TrmB [Clostridia bacterium]|nr:tRNA (guanosine(46)-N7)-methyltransferase TrmB [Clostridia bacterium]